MRVVVVGSLNRDHTVRVDRLPPPGATVIGRDQSTAAGGKGLNQAVAAARQGVAVALVGAVGADQAGTDLLALLDAEGIDRRTVVVHPRLPTGAAWVTVAEGGTNTIVVVGGANTDLRPEDVPPLLRDDVVLVQLETPLPAVIAVLERAREVGALSILNPAPAPGPLPDDLLALVDVVVPNETELAALAPGATTDEAAARSLLAGGVGTVVVTRGAAGALVVDLQVTIAVPSFVVDATDATGAGDALCGVMAAALVAGLTLEAAVRRGTAAGALATTAAGAVPSLPPAAAIDRLLG